MKNDVNVSSAEFTVVAESKPSSPEALHFTVIQGSVYFDWKRGFNGGHPQTFIVQLSKDSLDNYINHTTISEEGSFNTNDMVTVKVTNLDVGVYRARLRTFNAIGAAGTEVFGVFTIAKVSDGTESTSSATTGAVAGGIIGSLCGIIAIGLAVVAVMRYECIRRQVLCDGHSGSRQNETSQCEGNGTDLNNQAYASLDVGQCKAIYTSLSQQAGHDNPLVYDNSEINAEEAVYINTSLETVN